MTVSSDFAKAHPPEVAALASIGYITTETPDGFGRKWRITARGLAYLEAYRA